MQRWRSGEAKKRMLITAFERQGEFECGCWVLALRGLALKVLAAGSSVLAWGFLVSSGWMGHRIKGPMEMGSRAVRTKGDSLSG